VGTLFEACFLMSKIKLRDYQEVAVAEIRAEFRAKNTPVLFVLPTGGGKTFTFSYIASNAADKGGAVCIIVHRKELLLQASASLRALGIEHGLISPHFTPNPHALVQVASVDTLLIRLKKIAYKFKLLIFDEAHHVVAENKWGRAYELLGKPHMLGVTATPVRTDGKGLGEHAGGVFKAMVLGPAVAELIERGMLINPVVYTSLEVPDLKDVRRDVNGEYNARQLAAAVDKPKITGSAVAQYTKICPGRRAIVFCSSVEHAKHVVAEFNEAGFKFDLLVGEPEMSDAERTDVNKRLRAGELHGACTVDLVSEGYDLPDLECCIMLRPTASEALFLQQVGRVMRISEGKTTCYLLDHVGNVGVLTDGEFKRKHGLPNELREWSLDGRKKKKKGPKELEDKPIEIKQCPKCFVAHEPATHCPKCGFEYPVSNRQLEQVEGELHQVTEAMQAKLKQEQRSAQSAAKSVEDMMQQLGYSRTRAEAIVKAREEKAALRTSLIFDLQDWRRRTGQDPLSTFGVELHQLKMYKPKALKELRDKFDAHCAQYAAGRTAPLRGDLFQQPAGDEPAF
jgi:DNA repair protein RadD